MSYTQHKIDELAQEFSDDAWDEFHNGNINNEDELHDFERQWIDDKTIYTEDCKKYVDDLNYDVFEEHEIFGRAEDWSQAAYNAIFEALNESYYTVSWPDMEHILKAEQHLIQALKNRRKGKSFFPYKTKHNLK